MERIALPGISVNRLSAIGTVTPSPFSFLFRKVWERINKEAILVIEWNNLICGQKAEACEN